MFDNDYDKILNSLEQIGQRHSFDEQKEYINPYKNKIQAQVRCKHMWENDTDAIYYGPNRRPKCAICGKEF